MSEEESPETTEDGWPVDFAERVADIWANEHDDPDEGPKTVEMLGVKYHLYNRAQVADLVYKLHKKGWSLAAISNLVDSSLGWVNRRLHWKEEHPLEETGWDTIVPDDELPYPPNLRGYRIIHEIPEKIVLELQSLQPVAQYNRGKLPAHSPFRLAAERINLLLAREFLQGASYRQLAEAIGIGQTAVRLRLGRYGIIDLPESQRLNKVADITKQLDLEALSAAKKRNSDHQERTGKPL